jgi:two-component system response regulator RegX3
VKRLRGRIEEEPATPKHLVTVRGVGYKFEP